MSGAHTGWTAAACPWHARAMGLLLSVLVPCAVYARSAPAEFVIEAEVLPAQVYVGAEARLRLRLLSAPGASYGLLRPPALGDAADLRPLGPLRTYETRRAGANWQVRERAYAIVPRRAGSLVVPGAELDGPLRYADVSGRDGRPVLAAGAVRGPQRTIEVLPQPAGAGERWLPARRVTLEESWSHDLEALAAGVPLTRTLVLRAEGLAADRLPPIEMAALPALAVHHDLPELFTEYLDAGMAGRRVQRIVLMPLAEGRIELPALSVRWWDVAAEAPRAASLAPRSLRAGAALALVAAPGASQAVSPRDAMRAFAVAVMLLSIAVLWWHLRALPLHEARRHLREACRLNNAPAARDALVEWWKVAAPHAQVPLLRRMGDAWPDAEARAQLDALEAALYGGRSWDGKAFWQRAKRWLRRGDAGGRVAERGAASPVQSLPPFFRLQERSASDGTTLPRRIG